MNIFFNSRINANQSLLNVLFGQQQKAASSQNTGCRGTRDTLTISASGKEKLTKSTSGRTHNTSIDSSIDLKSYKQKKRIKRSLRMQEHRLMRKQVNI